MYATEVNGRVLNLAVSGKLWRRSLVMIDEETNSLWSQLLGKAMDGDLKHTRLELIPSVLTDWASWKREHPTTTVLSLSRTARNFKRDMYKDPGKFVVGISWAGAARAWAFDQLIKKPLINDEFNEQPVVVYFEPNSSATYIYDRRLDGKVLTFKESAGKITDNETNSSWNLAKGTAVDGPVEGSRLKPLAGVPSFRKSWKTFFPDSEYYSAK